MKNKYLEQEYLYDFSKDGGAIGTIVLSDKNGKNPLPAGAIVKHVTAKVVTACTSGGSATVSWGHSTVTAYSGTAIAVASLAANAVFCEEVAGGLLWDSTAKASTPIAVTDETTNGTFKVAIAAATLLTGKIVFVVEYLYPAVDV